MSATELLAYIGIGGTFVGILGGGGLLGWWWRKAPERLRERERNAAVADAILGESEVLDRSNRQIQPARPGLVHRVASVEEAVKTLTELVADQRELRGVVENHETRISGLETAALERIVTKAESTAAWEAVAKRDVIDGDEGA